MNDQALIVGARRSFHSALLRSLLRADSTGIPSNADKHSRPSVGIAVGILQRLGESLVAGRLAGQMAGSRFEEICEQFLKQVFPRLTHLRPGHWEVGRQAGSRPAIAQYDQYEHLEALETAARSNRELAAALGGDYIIKPDLVIVRHPESDEKINLGGRVVDDTIARLSPLRKANNEKPILHASISCKWTLQSDRAQNSRSEALNLVRNRKGRLPHIAVLTGEPMPSRIASIALGTGGNRLRIPLRADRTARYG